MVGNEGRKVEEKAAAAGCQAETGGREVVRSRSMSRYVS